jgi:hypothetical protein
MSVLYIAAFVLPIGLLLLTILFAARYRILEKLPKSVAKFVIYRVVSSVDKRRGYGLDYRRTEDQFPEKVRDFFLFSNVKTGFGAHPTSYTTGTGRCFPGSKATGA